MYSRNALYVLPCKPDSKCMVGLRIDTDNVKPSEVPKLVKSVDNCLKQLSRNKGLTENLVQVF